MGKFNQLMLSPNSDNIQTRVSKIIDYANNLKVDGNSVFSAETETIAMTDGYAGNYYGAKISIVGTDVTFFYGYREGGLIATGIYVKLGDDYVVNPSNIGNDYQGSYALYATSYVDEKLILLNYADSHNGRYDFEIVFTTSTDSTQLLGYGTRSMFTPDNGYIDIHDLTFKDISSLSDTYTYTNMFPYTATAGTIDFLMEGFLVNTVEYKSFILDALRECSTVPVLSGQSLSTGNCIALGAHCLAPLDEEGE